MFPFNFESLFLHLSFEMFSVLFFNIEHSHEQKIKRWCKFPLRLFIINILFVCLLVKGKNINNVFWYVSFISMIMTLYTQWKVICTNIYIYTMINKCRGNLHHLLIFCSWECSILKNKTENISKLKCKNREYSETSLLWALNKMESCLNWTMKS
jgi:hypothetical protein